MLHPGSLTTVNQKSSTRVDHAQEAVEVDRLGDEAIGVLLVGAHDVGLGLGRGEHDDRDGAQGGVVLDLSETA